METWFVVVVSLCISALFKSFFVFLFSSSKHQPKLPPGPPPFSFITSLRWLRRSSSDIEPNLRTHRAKYGHIFTLRIRSLPVVFVASHSLAYQALVQNGAVFADRPAAVPTTRLINGNQHNLGSAAYGPNWRLLRRNLTSEILHPSRLKSFSRGRKWVLRILVDRLKAQSQSGEPVCVFDHFSHAMSSLLAFMCFGDEFEEDKIKEIRTVQGRLFLRFNRFRTLNFWPRLGKILFRNRWKELMELCKNQEDVFVPLIRGRMEAKQEMQYTKTEDTEEDKKQQVLCYVDTLFDLQLPEEKRKLEEGEMVSLCSEFIAAGNDTTSSALQWIMANLVKYPHIQERLFAEISGVIGLREVEEVKEEDLQKMPYLKAVILEGLRRHPPAHFPAPHAVTEDVALDGYVVPKKTTVNFMVAEMGWDPKVWEDPMEFKPERFLSNGNGDGEETFDLTGSREIKMMPFGAGRRICPALGLAMLHLEYFVATLVWHFEWKALEGDEVDLSEKQELAIVMKNPLRAHLSPRSKQA